MSEAKGTAGDPMRDAVEILRGILAESKATNERLDGLEVQARTTNERLAALNTRVESTNIRLDGLDRRLEVVEGELGSLRREMNENFAFAQAAQKDAVTELRGLRGEAGQDLVDVKNRLDKLEAAVFKPPRPGPRARGARR